MSALVVVSCLAAVLLAAVVVDTLRAHGAVLRRLHEIDPGFDNEDRAASG